MIVITAPESDFELLAVEILDVLAEHLVQQLGDDRFEDHLGGRAALAGGAEPFVRFCI